jgi:POT family proton-dependent oligopeptide transporter
MGMTYDQKRPGQEQLRTDAFFMYYFAINVGSTFSYLVLPIVSKHFGYAVAFAVPSVLMAVALTFFALGKKHYAVEVIQRRHATPEEKAERRRVLARIFGVFAMIVLWWAVYDQNDVTWVLFIKDYVNLRLDLYFFSLDLLPNQPHSLNPILILVFVPLFTILFRWLDPTGKKFPATRKIMIGFLLMALAVGVMSLAGFLATTGRTYSVEQAIAAQGLTVPGTLSPVAPQMAISAEVATVNLDRVSMWWIVLAFVLLTASEVLVSTVGLELAFTAAPNSMKSFVTGCFLATVGIANLLNVPISRLYGLLGPGLFFAVMAATMVVFAVGIIPVGRAFNRGAAAAATALGDGAAREERIPRGQQE